ncbi:MULTISPECIES: ATP-binding protein [Petrimonas]|jgi:serine/threonine-protein kinase RsbT|uniref:Anti-sigma B factor RsbT n=1 Tax=Petrimonas mucosa TaxID=1642646 RepID=A0A1G4G565_9BACT|nr:MULTISPECIES: ATP-binding protein [Petrimonas]MDD3560784.1 ATP-binding protein [Petrimonas mucosa]SCM56373.1 Anti-sigma B factor RsbT {ECO:0000313/EMBL:GAO30125,1} [Petrimonas mucosa]SFU43660.1 Anti-sigma regulatory factor (Ser/Thr protein kinase) [Porphyromonadaceae bacterium KHP3R9]HHT29257.1 anti-sigma regulatory factor [Petrimonas mucosa]
MQFGYEIIGGDFSSAGQASSDVKKILKQLNIDPQVVRKIAVAVYEAEVNVVAHAYKGVMQVELDARRIRIVLEDEGPGIEDIGRAMQEGFSTASETVRQMGFGAGMGLPNIKRNTDEMHLSSVPGEGTTLEMIVRF